jgi:MYND finger
MDSLPTLINMCSTCGIGEDVKKLFGCSNCEHIFYCSELCQKNNQSEHKITCGNPFPAIKCVEILRQHIIFLHKMMRILSSINHGKNEYKILQCDFVDFSDKKAIKCELWCIHSDEKTIKNDKNMAHSSIDMYILSFGVPNYELPTPSLSFPVKRCNISPHDTELCLVADNLLRGKSHIMIVTPTEVY